MWTRGDWQSALPMADCDDTTEVESGDGDSADGRQMCQCTLGLAIWAELTEIAGQKAIASLRLYTGPQTPAEAARRRLLPAGRNSADSGFRDSDSTWYSSVRRPGPYEYGTDSIPGPESWWLSIQHGLNAFLDSLASDFSV